LATAVNLKTAAQTVLIPVQSGRSYLVRALFVRLTNVNTLTVPPILRVGNSVNFDNIAALTTLTGGITSMLIPLTLVTGVSLLIISIGTTAISLDVQTGATATTCIGDIWGEGYIL